MSQDEFDEFNPAIFNQNSKLNKSNNKDLTKLDLDEHSKAILEANKQNTEPAKSPLEPKFDSNSLNSSLDEATNKSQAERNITHRRKPIKPFEIKVNYDILQDSDIIESESFEFETQVLQIGAFKETIENNIQRNVLPLRNLSNWTLTTNMATPIKEVTDLIKEYNGEEKYLNSFIKNIDKLWVHIADHDNADKNRFLLVLQLKLTESAAEAVKDTEFINWDVVKKALKEHIKTPKNIGKAELKLTTVKQLPNEELEDYAKRVERLMDDLNKCFELEAGYDVLKRENARKARKSFENGLSSPSLKNKAIARGLSSLNDVVDYVIEQELRLRIRTTGQRKIL